MRAKLYIMMTMLFAGGLVSGCIVAPGGYGYGHHGHHHDYEGYHDHGRR